MELLAVLQVTGYFSEQRDLSSMRKHAHGKGGEKICRGLLQLDG
jgi:hypothetical protein